MNRLWMLFVLIGCASPTEPQAVQKYELQFVKDVDTVFVDRFGGQVVKHIGAVTNVRSRRMVLVSSNIYVQATAGFGYVDTVSTVNGISHTNKGYVGTAFGAFPNMIGMTATIIAKVVDDIRTAEEFRYPELRKVLATDTMRVVILARK